MSIEVTVGRNRVTNRPGSNRVIETGLEEISLRSLFHTVAKHHPELAPLLEDATQADDLDIFVNDKPVSPDAAEQARLHDGDSVALILK